MKTNRLFTIGAVLMAGLSVCAIAKGETTWAQSYGVGAYATFPGGDGQPVTSDLYGSGTDTPAGLAPMPDGGFVVVGQLDLPEFGSFHTGDHAATAMVRYGVDGTILWQQLLRDTLETGIVYVDQIRADTQGNIFIAGSKHDAGNGTATPFVAKFSSAGALVWENGVAGSHYLVPNPKGPPTDVFIESSYTFLTMNLTSDGGVVAGGTESTTNGADPHAVPSLAKFGPSGSLVFNKLFDYTVSGLSYEPTFAVCQSVDGMHYLALLAVRDNGMTAILTDAAGNNISQRTFFIPAGRDFPAAALATADGGFITYSQISNPGGASVGAVVRKLQADLTPVWEKVLANNYGSQPATFAAGPAIVQTADGGFLISGHMSGMFLGYDLGSENSDAVLVKLDANGVLQAAHLLGGLDQEGVLTAVGGGPESFCMAIQTTDGGYALALPTISYKTGAVFPDWWVAKTDANGRVSGFPDVTGELPSFIITSVDNTQASQAGGIFGGYPPNYSSTIEGFGPGLTLEDLSARTGINRPNVQVQAASFTGPDLLPTSGLLLQSDTYQVHRAWRFQAIQSDTATGLSLHVQFSTAPLLENSWTEVPGGGQMTLISPVIGLWELNTTQPVPDSTDARTIFFRVISVAAGDASTVTNFSEPYTINSSVPDLPPTVQITAPAGSAASNPSTSEGSSLTVSVTANDPDDGLVSIAFYDNGSLISEQPATSGNSFSYVINQIGPGKHLLEAKAKDMAGLETASSPVTIYVSLTNGTIYTFTGSGDWNSATNWTPSGIPGPNDTAVVGAGSVSLSQNVTIRTISLDGGSVAGPGALTVTNSFVISTGQLTVDLTINPGATCALIGDTDVTMSGTVVNNGNWIISGYGGIAGVPTGNAPGGESAGPQSNAPDLFHAFATFFNRAVFAATHPRGGQVAASRSIQCYSYTNTGRTSLSGVNIIGHDGAGRPAHSRAAGSKGSPARGVKNEDPPTSTPAAYTQDSGETDLGSAIPLEQGRIFGPVVINGGVLTGSGVINGDLTNNGGVVSPGHSAGRIQVTGDFMQASAGGQTVGGTLVLELGGTAPSQYDQLQVGGAATFGGTLNIQSINNFTPQATDVFAPVTYASHTGSFASVSSNAQIFLGATGTSVSVDPTALQPSTGQPLNISTRMKVLSGDNVLITGFIVTGPSGSTKKVLIRGIGPSLAQSGVQGTLPDPFLELHEPDGTVVTNDNWADAPNVGEIPPGFAPGDPNESVVIATLSPGSYTAIVKGAHGETGIGLAEVYDLDAASLAKLANISTRGFIDTGDNVMIGGFIVGGTEPARILVRAGGPSLGVQGALEDPTLELHDANGGSFDNDGWRESQESEIIATTIPPSNDREPAILATLVPGSYTVIVRGKNDTTGIGLVEAYNLQ